MPDTPEIDTSRVDAMSASNDPLGLLPEPVGYITRESKTRIGFGGNHAGTVPMHSKRSPTACISMYTKEQMQAERERCYALGLASRNA